MYFINDKVKEKFSEHDYFDGKGYVKKLKEIINNDYIKSIGIYGKWGIGKTSIIKNTISELVKEKTYDSKNIIEYNAWKYNEYDFMRDFLIECSSKIEGKDKAAEREESYYSDSSEDRQLYLMLWSKLWEFIKKSFRVLIFLFIIYILIIGSIIIVNNYHRSWYDCADLITPVTLTFLSFLLPMFLVSEISHKSYIRKFSPEQFARDFNEIVSNKKVLIIIDDIDRCDYKEIKSTFDTLKTFIIDENNNVKFIIPVDPNILFNSLEDQTYDYFTKIIDYSMEIKNYIPIRFELLKNEIIENVNEEYKDIVNDGLYLASKFYIDTPRKMKKFANEFINEVYGYFPKQLTGKGFMFAKLIILKNEFPKYYYQLIMNYANTMNDTKISIDEYEKKGYDFAKTKNGIKFNINLLEFLSKTDNVDLYDFSLYVNNTNYDEYKIKKICESPIERNKFDNGNLIDLEKNISVLYYEFEENILKPLKNHQFIYGDPFKRITFLLKELYNQKNSDVINKKYDELSLILDELLIDRNFTKEVKIEDDKTLIVTNVDYINDCMNLWIDSLAMKNNNILEDNIIKFILDKLDEDSKDQFEYIKNELMVFVQKFKDCKNISNKNLLNIIKKFLEKDFELYNKDLLWFFEGSYSSEMPCYVTNLINLVDKNVDIPKELFKEFLNKRYSKTNSDNYFNSILTNIEKIKIDYQKYAFLIEPLTLNLNSKYLVFSNSMELIKKVNYHTNNYEINELIFKLLIISDKIIDFNEADYDSILSSFGLEINSIETIDNELCKFLKKNKSKDIKTILGFDSENNIFKNFNILKQQEGIFSNLSKTNEIVKIVCITYKNEEDYVIKSDVEKHGLYLDKYYNLFLQLINSDINSYIYLSSDFSHELFLKINFSNIDINNIKYDQIDNTEVKNKILLVLKEELDSNLKQIRENKNDKDILKNLTLNFLNIADKIYVNLNYSDKTLWTKLKIIDEFMSYSDLTDSFYLDELSRHEGIINLFKNGKYRDNYKKNNIHADKVINKLLNIN